MSRELVMDHDQICSWLQLSKGSWPPDHYTLLGLQPGESDCARIEEQVHQRMEKVRVYQLPHPELATEAMNRLAQALICLTDPTAKQTYDQKLLPEKSIEQPPPVRRPPATAPGHSLDWLFGRSNPETAGPQPTGEPQAVLNWETTPPPQRLRTETEMPAVPATNLNGTAQTPAPQTTSAAPDSAAGQSAEAPASEQVTSTPVDSYAEWRKGLGTRRALHYRIVWHRQLEAAWQGAGKYLNRPQRTLNRPAEATDLINHMQSIQELLRFQPLFGQAGQPGYLVVTLARQQMIVPTLQTLLPSQREALARDWQTGSKVLQRHRQFLRQELRASRRRGGGRQVFRMLTTSLVEHPGVIVLLVALVAVNVRYQQVWQRWPEQLVCLLTLVAVRLAFWKYSTPPVRRRRARPAPAPVTARKVARRPRKLPNSTRA